MAKQNAIPLKEKYFKNCDSAWNLDPKIINAVKFEHFNLMNDFSAFGTFDMIFCRYVLIYFSDELKKEIAEKMHDSLNDDGVFFTGNYVVFDLFRDSFDMKHYENLTYYTRKLVNR